MYFEKKTQLKLDFGFIRHSNKSGRGHDGASGMEASKIEKGGDLWSGQWSSSECGWSPMT